MARLATVSNDKWAVMTSINPPTEAVTKVAGMPGWSIVVVADLKTEDFGWPNGVSDDGKLVYLSVHVQRALGYRLHDILPYNHYARKNIGYLFAIDHGAKILWDSDDDNVPSGDILEPLDPAEQRMIYQTSDPVVNPYDYFSRPQASLAQPAAATADPVVAPGALGLHLWPRGYPLAAIAKASPPVVPVTDKVAAPRALIQQGLANGDPDLDALYRLVNKKAGKSIRITFAENAPLQLPIGTLSPTNSQNTFFLDNSALWATLIPLSTAFRVCDIWRGYWTQRLLWDIGGAPVFTRASVFQDRNEHDYFLDFEDEDQLYKDGARLVDFLRTWSSQAPLFETRMVELAQAMHKEKFWGPADVRLVRMWVEDLKGIGYRFPTPLQLATGQLPTAFSPTNTDFQVGDLDPAGLLGATSADTTALAEYKRLELLPSLRRLTRRHVITSANPDASMNMDFSWFIDWLPQTGDLVFARHQGCGWVSQLQIIANEDSPEHFIDADLVVHIDGVDAMVVSLRRLCKAPSPFVYPFAPKYTFDCDMKFWRPWLTRYPLHFHNSIRFSLRHPEFRETDYRMTHARCMREDTRCPVRLYWQVDVASYHDPQHPACLAATVPNFAKNVRAVAGAGAKLQQSVLTATSVATLVPQALLQRKHVSGRLCADGQGSATILDLKQAAGTVTMLRIALRGKGGKAINADWRAVQLRVTFDGASAPQIDVPVADFFGHELIAGQPASNMAGAILGVDKGGVGYCHLPMPFWQSLTIELAQLSGDAATVAYDVVVSVSPFRPNATSGAHLRVQSRRFEGMGPSLLFDVARGAGHIVSVAHVYHFTGQSNVVDDQGDVPTPRCSHEGDFWAYQGNSRFPFLRSSGTEDFFGNSKGWMVKGVHPLTGVPYEEAATEANMTHIQIGIALGVVALALVACSVCWRVLQIRMLPDAVLRYPAVLLAVAALLVGVGCYVIYDATHFRVALVSAFRQDVANPISFDNGCRVYWEHGSDTGFRSTTVHRNYMFITGRTIVHYYLNTAPTTYLVGKVRPKAGGAALPYKARSQFASPSDDGQPEELEGVVAREGQTVEFSFAVPAARKAVGGRPWSSITIRRTYDACVRDQRARVTVGGQVFRDWHSEVEFVSDRDLEEGARQTLPFCFAMDEFDLPQRLLTPGATNTVSLQALGNFVILQDLEVFLRG